MTAESKEKLRELSRCGKQGKWQVLGLRLKPCPFCGRAVELHKVASYDRKGVTLQHHPIIYHEDVTAWDKESICMMDVTTFGWKGATWTERDRLIALWNERTTT